MDQCTRDSKKLLQKCQKQDLIDINVIVLIGKGKTCLSMSLTARLVATYVFFTLIISQSE